MYSDSILIYCQLLRKRIIARLFLWLQEEILHDVVPSVAILDAVRNVIEEKILLGKVFILIICCLILQIVQIAVIKMCTQAYIVKCKILIK